MKTSMLFWITGSFTLLMLSVGCYLLLVYFDSDPKVRSAFRNHNMIGMSQAEVKNLLGNPPAARDYFEENGATYYSWDYTRRKNDRIWLARRHKVIFDKNGKMVVKIMSYYSDDDDD